MGLFSIIGIKLLNFIIGMLPEMNLDIPAVENIQSVSNIFAWVNFFLPSQLILTLLGILTTFYTFKATPYKATNKITQVKLNV